MTIADEIKKHIKDEKEAEAKALEKQKKIEAENSDIIHSLVPHVEILLDELKDLDIGISEAEITVIGLPKIKWKLARKGCSPFCTVELKYDWWKDWNGDEPPSEYENSGIVLTASFGLENRYQDVWSNVSSRDLTDFRKNFTESLIQITRNWHDLRR